MLHMHKKLSQNPALVNFKNILKVGQNLTTL